MLESGKSINWAYDYYSKLGYETKTACLFILKETEVIPDFYIKVVNDKMEIPLGSQVNPKFD